jgi:hypothetical protein
MSRLSILDIKSEALLPSSARHGVPSAPYAPAAFWLGCFAASVHEGWQAELLLAACSGEGSRRAQRAAGKQTQKGSALMFPAPYASANFPVCMAQGFCCRCSSALHQ